MSTQTLTLAGWWPTPLNRLMRLHPMRRERALKLDADVIALECCAQGITRATGKRRVSLLVRYDHAGHCPDSDGLLKSLLDALVKCRRLLDDDRNSLDLGPITFEAAPRKGLVVVFEDV